MAMDISKTVRSILIVVIGIVIVFQLLADTAQDVADAAGNITAQSATYPLTNFFKKKGVLLLALMAGIVLLFIDVLIPGGRRR